MSEEIIDTNPDIFPEGDFNFTCRQVVKKLDKNDKPYYIFEFEAMVDGVIKNYKEFRQPWMSGDLILALGGSETDKPGVYKWDRESAKEKKIVGTIIHEPDFKDKSKMRAKITNPVAVAEEIPF